jgi:hypothetical protein
MRAPTFSPLRRTTGKAPGNADRESAEAGAGGRPAQRHLSPSSRILNSDFQPLEFGVSCNPHPRNRVWPVTFSRGRWEPSPQAFDTIVTEC